VLEIWAIRHVQQDGMINLGYIWLRERVHATLPAIEKRDHQVPDGLETGNGRVVQTDKRRIEHGMRNSRLQVRLREIDGLVHDFAALVNQAGADDSRGGIIPPDRCPASYIHVHCPSLAVERAICGYVVEIYQLVTVDDLSRGQVRWIRRRGRSAGLDPRDHYKKPEDATREKQSFFRNHVLVHHVQRASIDGARNSKAYFESCSDGELFFAL